MKSIIPHSIKALTAPKKTSTHSSQHENNSSGKDRFAVN